jgi:hypothetical protein
LPNVDFAAVASGGQTRARDDRQGLWKAARRAARFRADKDGALMAPAPIATEIRGLVPRGSRDAGGL